MSGKYIGQCNCDKHLYTNELAIALRRSFAYLNSTKAYINTWEDNTTKYFLHTKNEDLSKLKELYRSIRNSSKKKVFIGPRRLKDTCKLLKSEFLEIPELNSFANYNSIWQALKLHIQDGGIYIFSTGMSSKVLIADSFYLNSNITCIDAGSSFDPVFGLQTRTNQASTPELLELYADFLNEPQIPKRIISIWLSEDSSIPLCIQKCLDSQRKVAGYDHYLITLDNYPKNIPYVEAAIAAKKWVKASDYLRFHELIEHGGIYCDADVEILPGKNFDIMLHNSLFVSSEPNYFIASSIVGSSPNHPVLKAHLEEVVQKFKGDDDKFFESIIEILTPRIYEATGDPNIRVYSSEYFLPYDHQAGTIEVTKNTICFHHFVKSWVKKDEEYLPFVSILLPTLGREEGLKLCLESIDRLYYPKHRIEVLVDDGPGTVPEKVHRLFGKAKGDVIVFASNDIEFTPNSLYTAIKQSHGHGLVSFNTGAVYFDKGNICEHFLIWRDTIQKIGGEIFSTKFHHVGCDNLLWAKCTKLNESYRCEEAVVKHKHFSNGGQVIDEVYKIGWSKIEEDRAILDQELEKLYT